MRTQRRRGVLAVQLKMLKSVPPQAGGMQKKTKNRGLKFDTLSALMFN
jgi:hypothetical protein